MISIERIGDREYTVKAKCPAGCGKKFISEQHAKAHADKEHEGWDKAPEKAKGWATPYGFIDMKHPVTYEEACATMQEILTKTNQLRKD